MFFYNFLTENFFLAEKLSTKEKLTIIMSVCLSLSPPDERQSVSIQPTSSILTRLDTKLFFFNKFKHKSEFLNYFFLFLFCTYFVRSGTLARILAFVAER